MKSRDWVRFAGREVAVRGRHALVGDSTYLEGELLELLGEGEEERVRLRLSGGNVVEIPRRKITRANLVHRWK